MDSTLFTVNRYWGSDAVPEKVKNDKSTTLLEKIKAEAERRRLEKVKSTVKNTDKVTPAVEKDSKDTCIYNQESKQGLKKRQRKRKKEKDDEKCESREKKIKTDANSSTETERQDAGNSTENIAMETDIVLPVDLSEEMRQKLMVSAQKDEHDNGEEISEERFAETPDQHGPHEIGGYTVLGDFKPKQIEKVKRVLPEWLAFPNIVSADISHNKTPVKDVKGLHPVILEKLEENGISSFFPVQSQVIPAMLTSLRGGYHVGPGGYKPSDICCSAPTGSGKTLAFVIPVLQALLDRVVCQIRAIVILPVQDLARQVYGVFQTYSKGTNVKVGLIIGQKSFESEQQSLVKKRLRGYQSQFDIVIATPGRLVDHINKTKGFDLRHLRFLVIDEADRMTAEVKQDWLSQVERAVFTTKYGQGFYPEYTRPLPGNVTVANAAKLQMPVQKLLFSATLSQNPEKLQELKLFQPKLFTSVLKEKVKQNVSITEGTNSSYAEEDSSVVDTSRVEFVGKYTTPVGLSEHFVQSITSEKPLIVLHLLQTLGYRQILCFTNSVETTHRLFLLVKLAGDYQVKEFSSKLHAGKRKRILDQFVAGKIDLLICSDAMARGMDVENVKYVVSYDPPLFIKTYIHRVGRTARAGKTGTAITLLQKKEVFHFKKMLRDAGKTSAIEMKIPNSQLEPLVPKYQEALNKLEGILTSEKRKSR